jgi:hypothetical protein
MALIDGFDIFRLEGASAPQWVAAVADLVAAKGVHRGAYEGHAVRLYDLLGGNRAEDFG